MSDWEDEDAIQAIPVQVPGQWDDEDQEEYVVKVEHNENVDHKVNKVDHKVERKLVSKKKNLKQKIQEKSSVTASAVVTETAEETKARLLNEQLEADLENAHDLFSGMAVKAVGTNAFEHLNPTTAKEFDELKDIIIKKFSAFQGQLYSNFIENLIREISIDLSLDDSKRIVSTLNAMINEKQKSIKDAKKKKPSKRGITVIKGVDTTNYDDVYDDFDDFI